MDYLIAPTLFQNKFCRLPGIGTLEVVVKSADTYFGHHEILAPIPSIIFDPSTKDENIFNEFTALSELIKNELHSKKIVTLKGIGNFVLNTDDAIEFLPLKINESFLQPVIANRVLRQDVEHTILVGDKEVTNTAMTDYYDEEAKAATKNNWWIAAIILAVIGIAAIVIYISVYGVNSFGSIF